MKSARILVSVILLALVHSAYSQVDEPGQPPAAPARGTSLGSDIKNGARDIGHGIRNGARQLKTGIQDGARQFKHSVAVARCNNGEYSYTHHKTCNNNGGVREQLR